MASHGSTAREIKHIATMGDTGVVPIVPGRHRPRTRTSSQHTIKYAYPGTDGRRTVVPQLLCRPAPGHVQMIQTSINNARKAETKVASIEERIAERKAQWDVYLEDIKAAWVRESQRHEKDMARMREELATAVRYQDTARAELRDVHQAVVRGRPPAGSRQITMVHGTL